MTRDIRYQGVVLRDSHLLLVKHREHDSGHAYWIMPGGGRDPGETEEACVQRELLEETHLQVRVERLLLDEAGLPGGVYQRIKTYLCRVNAGEAVPGHEPEEEASRQYAISEVGWFDLRHPDGWDPLVKTDPFTYPLLLRLQALLGYTSAQPE